MPPSSWPKRSLARAESFLGSGVDSTWLIKDGLSGLCRRQTFYDNDGFSQFSHPFRLTFPVFLEAPHDYLYHIPLFFKPLSPWSQISLSRNFSDYRSRLLLVVSIGLSRLGSSLLLSSLVWYVFLLLPLFTFSFSGFRGSRWSLFVSSSSLFWLEFYRVHFNRRELLF